jgi:hypothetical protein
LLVLVNPIVVRLLHLQRLVLLRLGRWLAFTKGSPVQGLVLVALRMAFVERDLLLKDNIRTWYLPKGIVVKEEPARSLGVDANKNGGLGHGTKFATLSASRAFVEQDMTSAAPHAQAPDMWTSFVPSLIWRDTRKHTMGDEVGKSSCMEKGVAP